MEGNEEGEEVQQAKKSKILQEKSIMHMYEQIYCKKFGKILNELKNFLK